MNIPLKMNKDFEKSFKNIADNYGEDFEILNGVHESQLNFSDFIKIELSSCLVNSNLIFKAFINAFTASICVASSVYALILMGCIMVSFKMCKIVL